MPRNIAYPPGMRGTESGEKLYARWLRFRKEGLPVCPEFETYNGFYEWAMASGYRPGMRLIRLNDAKPYAPDNCVWRLMSSMDKNMGGHDAEREWINNWNRTVNRIRKVCGLYLFPVEE